MQLTVWSPCNLNACSLKSLYLFCRTTLFSLWCFDVNDYSRQMPIFTTSVLVCLRKLCQACSAICSCSSAILPFLSAMINNPTTYHSSSSTRSLRQEGCGSGLTMPSKAMHMAGWGGDRLHQWCMGGQP